MYLKYVWSAFVILGNACPFTYILASSNTGLKNELENVHCVLAEKLNLLWKWYNLLSEESVPLATVSSS